jgi:exopolyphosphatase/guanosine-5'-triphosphate,3'-diphosphate pyrophosphatase
MNPLASIEIGTNSIRMLIAEKGISENTLKPILRKRAITRLGKNFNKNEAQIIEPEPISRSISVLENFFDIARQFDISSPIVVATGVVREARNRNDFISLIEKKLGHNVKVITGEDESYLTRRGVLSSLDFRKETLVIFDCGGGSTEFVWTDNNKSETISINCGAVILTDDYLTNDPPNDKDILRVFNYIDNKFEVKLQYIKGLFKGAFSLVGTGGTIISLAGMIHGIRETEFNKTLNGLVIKRKNIEALFTKMKGMPRAKRLKDIAGLEPGREDIVVAGTIIVIKIMDYFEKYEIIVSYSDLLEGILLQYMGGGKNG